MRLKMKRGKSKLLSDTDVKNCLRFINDNLFVSIISP